MDKKLPTDPLADASTGVVRRSRGAFLKTSPMVKVERRDPRRSTRYTGPERRKKEDADAADGPPGRLFGFPRWLVIAAGVYVVALLAVVVLIFTW